MKQNIGILFGATAESIYQQLDAQGFLLGGKDDVILRWQKIADAITMLAVHGYLPGRNKHKARAKLMKDILRIVK